MHRPVEMTLTIGQIEEAVEYWLTNVVLKPSVTVKDVTFAQHPQALFKVTFKDDGED